MLVDSLRNVYPQTSLNLMALLCLAQLQASKNYFYIKEQLHVHLETKCNPRYFPPNEITF
jgi:hypothetical protein